MNYSSNMSVTVVLPIYNASAWLDECLNGILGQRNSCVTELSVFNDASEDGSMAVLCAWKDRLAAKDISMIVTENTTGSPMGVGAARNRAVRASSGEYLCFMDADDIMLPGRVDMQLDIAKQNQHAIIGSRFRRIPEGSTARLTRWANSLTPKQLHSQAYTSHGPTVIMPTWFCHREVFDAVGGFDESGKGTPEDLLFFYEHLRRGGDVIKVEEELLVYRYHPAATTFSVQEETIWNLRVGFLQERILSKWETFTIWNAGKQGRRLYRSLSKENQLKVMSFCDVDQKKLALGRYTYEDSEEIPKPTVPIVHFTHAQKPFVICVKLDLTGGQLEDHVNQLGLTEGVDYIHFN